MVHRRRPQITAAAACLILAVAFAAIGAASGSGETAADPPPFDTYLYFGDVPMWIGNGIHYTVYDTAVVEARFLNAGGEILLLLRLGEKAPGQYRVPWDGTVEGSPMAGFYNFELYYGDEYAADFQIIVSPAPK